MLNKTLIAAIICLLITDNAVMAQKAGTDTVVYYLKYPQKPTTRDSADFIRVVLPKGKEGLSPFLEYSKQGIMISRGLTRGQDYTLRPEGPFVSFTANGKRKSVKNYINGQLNGDVSYYYPNGKLYSIVRHKVSFPNIQMAQKIECRDTTGNVIAQNGKGHWIKFLGDDFNHVYEEGEVLDGQEIGVWTMYADGKKQDVIYKKGLITKPAEVNLADKVYEHPDSSPDFENNSAFYNGFLAMNIRYPAEDRERNIQGKVYVKFVVEKDGTTSNFEITQAPSKSLADEVLRVIKLSPPVWTPGTVNGNVVRSYGSLPVNFTFSREN